MENKGYDLPGSFQSSLSCWVSARLWVLRLSGEQKPCFIATLFRVHTVQKGDIHSSVTYENSSFQANKLFFCCFICSTSPEPVFHFHAAMFLLLKSLKGRRPCERLNGFFRRSCEMNPRQVALFSVLLSLLCFTFPSILFLIWSKS